MSQAEPVRTSLPRRDRLAIWTGLTGVTVLAWIYLVVQARQMASMPGSMPMEAMPEMVGVSLWSLGDFVLMFLMWAVMMVGMMVPTAAPMTLIYAAVARKAAAQANPLPPTAVFVSGYIAMWSLFSLIATIAQWGLDQAALISPMMVATSPLLGACLLIAAGAYQLTPFKDACLKHCRGPAEFFAAHWRTGMLGAFRMGLEHGAYCLGCCWVLMGLLFLGGVMNLVWIAAIAMFVLLEKILPFGAGGGRWAGAGMIVIGLFLLFELA